MQCSATASQINTELIKAGARSPSSQGPGVQLSVEQSRHPTPPAAKEYKHRKSGQSPENCRAEWPRTSLQVALSVDRQASRAEQPARCALSSFCPSCLGSHGISCPNSPNWLDTQVSGRPLRDSPEAQRQGSCPHGGQRPPSSGGPAPPCFTLPPSPESRGSHSLALPCTYLEAGSRPCRGLWTVGQEINNFRITIIIIVIGGIY